MKLFFWGDLLEPTPPHGYKCREKDCDWTTKYSYRNAKKAIKEHWTIHHRPVEDEPLEDLK